MTPNDPTPRKRRSRRKQLFTGFGVVLLFVLAFVVFFHFNFTSVVVSGQSMLPTLKNGKKVLVSSAYWLVGSIRDGDIVVIRGENPGDYIIKRIYKMAGERVDVLNLPGNWPLTRGEFQVPDDAVYVLGDNRSVSEDSRKLGPIDLDRIIGKVVAY